jgi:hypothetical protein
MTAQATASLATGEQLGTPRLSLGARLGALGSQLAAWVGTCADYYQAAALYDEFCGLADAELRRRGLSRATLAIDLSRGCDRASS